jgi:O-antigen ligase
MSRFNNPSALRTLVPPPVSVAGVDPRAVAADAAPIVRLPAIAEPRSSFLQTACFVALCAYLLSSYANEFAVRLTGGKAYISAVALVIMPVFFILTGKALLGASISLGKWWLAFGGWLAVCAPFSVWKSDTLNLLTSYYPRAFILYFIICACALSVGRLKTLMYVLGAGNLFMVLSCLLFGYSENGRFSVPGSAFSFLSNANELALQLLLGIVILVFAFFRSGTALRFVSACNIAASALYMLKTGSRGAFVAALAVIVAVFLLSRNKLKVIVMTLPLIIGFLLFLPASTWHRLTNISVVGKVNVSSIEDESTVGSQIQRQRLFWDSVWLTLKNPIVGVGPGQFIVQSARDKERKGEWADWRATHNSFTQVSSESGLPGFFFYVTCIVLCARMNYRMYRQTVDRPGLENFAGLSFCMLLSIIGYGVGTIFDHLAYTSFLPIILGITGATYLTLQPVIRNMPRAAIT